MSSTKWWPHSKLCSKNMSNSSMTSSICKVNAPILLVHFPIRITLFIYDFTLVTTMLYFLLFSIYCTFSLLVSTTELMTYIDVTKMRYTIQKMTSLSYMQMNTVSANCLFVCLMVFNAAFNIISAISWRSVLLVEETEGQ